MGHQIVMSRDWCALFLVRTMKLLTIADIDDLHWRYGAGKADLLLSCGDVFDRVILEAVEACGAGKVFAVKGNHDRDTPFEDPIIDLHLNVVEYDGMKFGGLNGCWKYKPHGPFLYEQSEVAQMLETFSAVDVLICHNSPRGIHDREDAVHIGYEALNTYIDRCQPKLMIHGHQHVDTETQVGETRVIGVYGNRLIDI